LDRAALVGVSVMAAGISAGTLDRSQRGDDSSAGQKALRMLVVDDEAPICFALSSYFTARGFEVDCADSADKAEALLRDARYAVLISDLRLAGSNEMHGLDIVAHVRRSQPETRCIVLTAYAPPEVESKARAIADVFLYKPVPLENLASVIDRLLKET